MGGSSGVFSAMLWLGRVCGYMQWYEYVDYGCVYVYVLQTADLVPG